MRKVVKAIEILCAKLQPGKGTRRTSEPQKDVHDTFLGGFAGQLVSAVLWGASATACTWHSLRLGEIILVLGGFFIFPLTQLLLRSMGHAHALPKGHPMNGLGMQVAFTRPLTLPVVIGIGAIRPAWFYPALRVTLGAHRDVLAKPAQLWRLANSRATLPLRIPRPISRTA